jgi:hypothetical protein
VAVAVPGLLTVALQLHFAQQLLQSGLLYAGLLAQEETTTAPVVPVKLGSTTEILSPTPTLAFATNPNWVDVAVSSVGFVRTNLVSVQLGVNTSEDTEIAAAAMLVSPASVMAAVRVARFAVCAVAGVTMFMN